jgi:cephalosporin hydroxylase
MAMHLIKDLSARMRSLVRNRAGADPKTGKAVVDEFHKLYYSAHELGKTWADTKWLGIHAQKCPLDLWIYQEIIFGIRPDVIIECGTFDGGSALFLASMCDLVGNGSVITIDIRERKGRPRHKRITYLHGSSTSEGILRQVRSMVRDGDRVLVILDSDHSKRHVLDELRLYNELVTRGSYIIVEDTCVNNHPILPDFGPGPMEAVEEFLEENDDFIIDKDKEKFYLTFNPNGYLKKVR